MTNKKSKYELLAPAGNFPMLVAAVNAGADAVYFGLKDFSMRANARNFTINVIIYDEELKKIERVIKKIKGKVDAVICWDLSVIKLCKKYKIPFHISTQASVANSEAAKFYKELGAERIVLARELNLKQIKEISKNIEIEAFIHGAMCVAVSGRCFMSQHLFGKSANRGQCIHPCRRTYVVKDTQEGYELKLENNKIMSAKDLCTLPFIEKLKNAGINSFKIEGRNRDPRYVDAVVKVYRKALDKKLSKEEIKESIEELKKVYNRKFSSGFYLGVPTSDDFTDVEHSAAKEKKHFIGKIQHFYPKLKVGTIKLVSELKLGDNINIIGKTTGIEKTEIKRIEIKNKPVKNAKKCQEIAIKFPSRVRKNDEVYVIQKNK